MKGLAMQFRSKIDSWLLIVLLASPVVAILGAFAVLQQQGLLLIVALTVIVGAALPLWILLSTRYEISGGVLQVKSGPFKWKIPAENITAISPTRSPLSSPALSLDRLRIDYVLGNNRKWVMVSPLNKEEFVRALEAAKSAA